jgi:Zn-dependent protease with chaperone function
MGLIGGAILPVATLILGTVNFVQIVILSLFVFIISLVISRCFEEYIDKIAMKILRYLNKYYKVKKFILKYF